MLGSRGRSDDGSAVDTTRDESAALREAAIAQAATSVERSRRFGLLQNRALLTLMLGHFTVDSYAGLLPVLYPLLIQTYSLDLKTVGLVSLAYSGASSLVQPLFGWLADKTG